MIIRHEIAITQSILIQNGDIDHTLYYIAASATVSTEKLSLFGKCRLKNW
jgi:hypothetical protein